MAQTRSTHDFACCDYAQNLTQIFAHIHHIHQYKSEFRNIFTLIYEFNLTYGRIYDIIDS